MLRSLIRSRLTRTAVVLVAAYWIAAFFVPAPLVIVGFSYILIAIAVAVTVAYLPSVVQALAEDRLDRVAQLTIGIVLSWMAIIMARGWGNAIRILDQDWMRNSPIVGFYLFISILAGVLHITAPGVINGKVPQRNWIILGCAIGAGSLVAGVLIGMQFASPS